MAYLVSLVLDEFLNSVRNGKIAFFVHKTNVTWKRSSKHSALVVFVVCRVLHLQQRQAYASIVN